MLVLTPRVPCVLSLLRSSSFLIDVQTSYQSGFTTLQVCFAHPAWRTKLPARVLCSAIMSSLCLHSSPVRALLVPWATSQKAKKLNTSIAERFAIFCREQERVQKTKGAEPGEESDLIQYVEYQRALRQTKRAHREALMAISAVWTHLCAIEVSRRGTPPMARVLRDVDASTRHARGLCASHTSFLTPSERGVPVASPR